MSHRPSPARGASIIAGILSLTACPHLASAAPCPVDPALEAGPLTARIPAEQRLEFIRTSMRVGAHRSRIWAASWGAAYGAASIALFTTASQLDGPVRRDLYVGASSALIGTVVRSVSIPKVIRSHRQLEKALRSGQSTCSALALAESGMHRSAKSETFGRSLILHLGALVYNVGVGVILGVALDRPVSGIRQAAVGMTVGQSMILTQPVTMVDATQRYRDGQVSAFPPRYLRPLTLRGGGGLTWGGRF